MPFAVERRYNCAMSMARADARRWLADFDAAETEALKARRAEGPQRERSIRLSLSLIETARSVAGGRYPVDPGRASSDVVVREIWNRLRTRSRL